MKKPIVPFFNKVILYSILAIRPLLGIAHCRYVFTCTQFAREQLNTQPLWKALWAIIKRVFSCNPLWKRIS